MPRITGRKIYKPANIQTNPVPHTEKPTATKAILTTNFMLIGRLLPCFLFFSILLIISDFFFAVSEPVYWPYVSDTSKGRCNPSKTNFWRINTLARSMRERGRFVHKPIWRQDSPEYLCIPNMRSISTPPFRYAAEWGRNYMERSVEKRRSDLSNNHAMIYIDLFVFHIEWKVVFLPWNEKGKRIFK